MDATGKNNNLQSERGYADHKVKLLRKEKHASNQNRLGSKNLNSEKANDKIKKISNESTPTLRRSQTIFYTNQHPP